jgi:hypothetical protein
LILILLASRTRIFNSLDSFGLSNAVFSIFNLSQLRIRSCFSSFSFFQLKMRICLSSLFLSSILNQNLFS